MTAHQAVLENVDKFNNHADRRVYPDIETGTAGSIFSLVIRKSNIIHCHYIESHKN